MTGLTLIRPHSSFGRKPEPENRPTMYYDLDAVEEMDELDVLLGIREGRLLLVEEYQGGKLVDRFFVHKDERVDLQYIEPGEELRYRRLE